MLLWNITENNFILIMMLNKQFYLFAILICFSCSLSKGQVTQVSLPDKEPIVLEPYGTIQFNEIDECSGFVKSSNFSDVFWMHNDSGDKARIFAVRKDGTLIKSKNTNDVYQGIEITSAQNQDWEDITVDDTGNLIIADSGNNRNLRKNLCIYFVKEPNPTEKSSAISYKKIPFHYTDQDSFPSTKMNFDAEAIFWANGKLYLLTKHRSDSLTKLYRFNTLHEHKSNPLTPIGTFDIKGLVTAADVSPDGKRLVVLTYTGIWLFETRGKSDNYFNGIISWLPIYANQCEGICFDGEKILISNEQRELFELTTDQLIVVKE